MDEVATSDVGIDQTARRHFILGTAGHIDHGKTSLIRALTGTDTDRLPEEQRRGMTIELGFAELVLGDVCFGIVDVPGHERFVRTMVAGATGVDLALLVVAADDSVMPQTVEHVDILNLLGVRHGLVAVTKIDAVDRDMVELVTEEVRELLAATSLEGAPIFPVSSVTNEGVAALAKGLVAAADTVAARSRSGPFRMTVDRVFTVQGRGTVVTGSALHGSVRTGDTLHVWPADETCRVRDLQAHGASHALLGRGQRCAINLSGIDKERLERGAELATPGYLTPSRVVDVRLGSLGSTGKALKSSSVIRLEIGTAEVPARVVLLEKKELAPGESVYAQLRSGTALTSAYGQRFIIRDENATHTIGGGVILRPVARRRRGDVEQERLALEAMESADPAERMEQVLRSHGFRMPPELTLSAQAGVEPEDVPGVLAALEAGGRLAKIPGTDVRAVPGAVEDIKRRLFRWLERFHVKNPESPGRMEDAVVGWLERLTRREIAKPLVDELVRSKELKRLGQFVCLPSFAPQLSGADEKLLARLVATLRAAGFQPPTLEEFAKDAGVEKKRVERLATLAVAIGDLTRVEGKIFLHAEMDRLLREKVAELVRQTGGVTVAEVREALDSSRKYVVPFMEYLDRVGYTCRVDDRRVLAAAE